MKTNNRSRMLMVYQTTEHAICWVVTEILGSKTKQDIYTARRILSQIGGIGVEVEKMGDNELRHVLLNSPGGGHTCDCRWGSFKPNAKSCRHVELCLAAIREGIL